MCGIAGLIKLRDKSYPFKALNGMLGQVAHRGPDDQGSVWFGHGYNSLSLSQCSPESGDWVIGIGNRRLAILDKSSNGHQPMNYREDFWVTFNGEIYNYKELRGDLEAVGYHFSSGSDTEVLLAAYAEWGDGWFARFRGMWALLLLDLARQDAVIARGRLGTKPIYLWQAPGIIAIASETKQLLSLPDFHPKLNHEVAAEYLATGYESGVATFFQDVFPLPPATSMHISLDSLKLSEPRRYWHPERIEVAVEDPEQAAKLFAYKLDQSVRLHLRSDVPIGCALSGGLDSSSIAMLAASTRGKQEPLDTFTSVFPGHATDESHYANLVGRAIDATSHFVAPTAEQFILDLDRFVWVHDEPVGSMSVYAGYCVARLVKQAGVKVSLSGQGGDEILGGYWQSYVLYLRDLLKSGKVLGLLSQLVGALLPGGNSVLVNQLPVMLRRYWARSHPRLPVERAMPRQNALEKILDLEPRLRRLREVSTFFLPTLLRWEDRNSMAFSVEGRYPFLDHELIELCLSFAPATLYHSGWSKWPLRLGLRKTLPPQIARRREKFGFETPQEDWLRGALRPTLEKWIKKEQPVWALLSQQKVQDLANELWSSTAPQQESSQTLFRVFMFSNWAERFGVALS